MPPHPIREGYDQPDIEEDGGDRKAQEEPALDSVEVRMLGGAPGHLSAAGQDTSRRWCSDGAVAGEGVPSRRKRPRGRRARGQGSCCDVILLNSSGKPQLLEALGDLPRKTTAAVLVQEHHATRDSLADLQSQVKELGWKLGPAEAVRTAKGGASAGTAVVVPSHVGWGAVRQGSWEIDAGPTNRGRLAAAWVQAGIVGGMLVISVYLHTNEGMTPRNRRLVNVALALAVSFGGAWVIAGDFNSSPQEMQGAVGHCIEKAGGTIRAPPPSLRYTRPWESRG